MIAKENMEIGGRAFVKTYSDAEFYIERDGMRYSEAIDPSGILRVYKETDEPISPTEEPNEIAQKAEAFDYLTGRRAADE